MSWVARRLSRALSRVTLLISALSRSSCCSANISFWPLIFMLTICQLMLTKSFGRKPKMSQIQSGRSGESRQSRESERSIQKWSWVKLDDCLSQSRRSWIETDGLSTKNELLQPFRFGPSILGFQGRPLLVFSAVQFDSWLSSLIHGRPVSEVWTIQFSPQGPSNSTQDRPL